MQKKKSPKADLQSKRVLFFQIGLAGALLVSIAAFSWGTTEIDLPDYTPPATIEYPDMVFVPRTAEEEPRAASTAPRTFIPSDQLRIVDNLTRPSMRIDFAPDIDEIFIDPVPVARPVEKPVDDRHIFISVSDMPQFMGGDLETFRRWVLSNLVYPQTALEHGIMGRVKIEFIVEKDGSISEIRVVESPDRILSDAAVNIIRKSPAWEPGRQQNKPVRVKFNMPVDFRIN